MAKKEPVDERNLDGYGAPTIPWARARERFEEDAGISPTHWLATVRTGGRPHVMPVWTVWVDGAFYFVAGTTTRTSKNPARNAPCGITPPSPGLALGIEGQGPKVEAETQPPRTRE